MLHHSLAPSPPRVPRNVPKALHRGQEGGRQSRDRVREIRRASIGRQRPIQRVKRRQIHIPRIQLLLPLP
ncbi:hypothetical protein T484DRAFT_1978860, partial [Baffinella frigidus]